MSIQSSSIAELPSAIGEEFAQRIADARPAVFLDYDGTLTPIVDRPQDAVNRLLSEHGGELKVTPGKMVYEIQPRLDWDKGRAVSHLLSTLGLEGDDVIPIYVGDDITDEHAFEAARRAGDRRDSRQPG